ncbi:hypothetical protein PENSPDRAFT_664693 [Peniophora sp. CONT]|nr:hypothetical protein PENSPDRAFT_664693 [Peniophora sp. CONT]
MDSDDEFDNSRLGIGVPKYKIFDWLGRDGDYVTSFRGLHPDPTPEEYDQAKNMLWSYHEDRFLDTLKGYHEGYCDLVGRHAERYTRLRKRFDELSDQFDQLVSRATLISGDETWGSGERAFVHKWYEYQFEDPQEWEAFAAKWHAPFGSAHRLSNSLREFKDVLATHPEPRFQKIMLLDLPVEILENITRNCDSTSLRQLYASCRPLRLLALADVYTNCTFSFSTFGSGLDWRQAVARDENNVSPYLRDQVDKHRAVVLRHMDSLRQRPEALDRTKAISFYDTWTCDKAHLLGDYAATGRSVEELLLPLLSRLSFFIFRCPLQSFYFHSHEFTGILWEAVRSNPTLHTLTVNARVQEDPIMWLAAPSLVNLHLFLQNGIGLRIWEIVPLCPNLRYLSFSSHERAGSRIPASIGSSTNNFRMLTRISLRGIQAKSVRFLIRALNDAASILDPNPLPLTHLRLDVRFSLLKRDMVFQLVSALSQASVRVLYLSQLQCTRPDIFQHIATNLPLLEALTLRHQQRAQAQSRSPLIWPHPAYEYAHALRHFPRLSFFGFNNELWRVGYTPFFLVEAEVDYADFEEKEKGAWKEWHEFCGRREEQGMALQDVAFHPEIRDYIGDSVSDVLPRLFATHCPTLRLFQAGYDKWAFDHRADGKIVARTNNDLRPAERRDAKAMYDEFSYDNWDV